MPVGCWAVDGVDGWFMNGDLYNGVFDGMTDGVEWCVMGFIVVELVLNWWCLIGSNGI